MTQEWGLMGYLESGMEETKEVPGKVLSTQHLLPWLEESLERKYSQSLHGVKERFLCIFSLFEYLLKGFIEISELVILSTSCRSETTHVTDTLNS